MILTLLMISNAVQHCDQMFLQWFMWCKMISSANEWMWFIFSYGSLPSWLINKRKFIFTGIQYKKLIPILEWDIQKTRITQNSICKKNSKRHQISITIQMHILVFFIKINFHHKDSILVAVITEHNPVDSSIPLNVLWQFSLHGLFTITGLQYSENQQFTQY